MTELKTSNPELIHLKGLHLWHAGLSTCSQRVRIALAELEEPFESHIVNLHAGENATEEYQAIHPDGVVPALVHDGRLIVESVDIIDYLDRELGSRKLSSGVEQNSSAIHDLMQRADQAQKHLKTLTFEFIFRAGPQASDEQVDAFQKSHKNATLKAFHREFRAGFSRNRIEEAAAATDRDFRMLEQTLSGGQDYLSGSDFGLADIAWIPNFHRFDLIGWPFERYPNLQEWFRRVSARPSYEFALQNWEPRELLDAVAPKLAARRAAGDGVETYLADSG